MQVIEKHGGSSHFVRPDRVYRTGVLSPWFNFAPGQDVQAVASEFTQRSMNLSGPSGLTLLGSGLTLLGAAGRVGFMERMRLRFGAWKARRDAANVVAKAMTPGPQQAQAQRQIAAAQQQAQGQADDRPFGNRGQSFHAQPDMHGMAYAQVGMQVAPHMMGQVSMLARLTSGEMPRHVAQAQVATTMERWHNLRWNS